MAFPFFLRQKSTDVNVMGVRWSHEGSKSILRQGEMLVHIALGILTADELLER